MAANNPPSTSCSFKKARHAWQVKNLNHLSSEELANQNTNQKRSHQFSHDTHLQNAQTSGLSTETNATDDSSDHVEMEIAMDLDDSSNDTKTSETSGSTDCVDNRHTADDHLGTRCLKRKSAVINVNKDQEVCEKKTRLDAKPAGDVADDVVAATTEDGQCPDCARLHQEGAQFLNTARQNFTHMVSTQCLRRECASSEHCPPSGQLPRNPATNHSFLQQWQNQHIAKAMVDNTINKTLEDMGWSPNAARDQFTDRFSRQQSRVVDAGVSEAIRACGLRRATEEGLNRLNPLVSTLTHMSESILTQRSCFRNFNSNHPNAACDASGNYVPSDSEESSVNDNEIVDSTDLLHTANSNSLANEANIDSQQASVDRVASPVFDDACSTDILDQAVTAAISEKGLSIL